MEIIKKEITVQELLNDLKEDYNFKLIGGAKGLTRKIKEKSITRPSLGFAGYTDFFLAERIQIIGETEISFLKTLPEDIQRSRIEKLVSLCPPCFIITKNLDTPDFFHEYSEIYNVPILKTPHDTTPFMKSLVSYLEYKLAEETYIHGTFVDVYGVGLLLIGPPGIGKSETALALISKGHKLIADDIVKVLKREDKYLIGMASDKVGGIQNFMEIRGIGMVNIYSIFGIRAVTLSKKIELIVEIKQWDKQSTIERTGLDIKTTEIMGIKIPRVTIPVIPGKSISVICELVALNFITKQSGYDAPQELQANLIEKLRQKTKNLK